MISIIKYLLLLLVLRLLYYYHTHALVVRIL